MVVLQQSNLICELFKQYQITINILLLGADLSFSACISTFGISAMIHLKLPQDINMTIFACSNSGNGVN